MFYFPGFGHLQPQKLRVCSESVVGAFPDLLRIWFRKCQTLLGARPVKTGSFLPGGVVLAKRCEFLEAECPKTLRS